MNTDTKNLLGLIALVCATALIGMMLFPGFPADHDGLVGYAVGLTVCGWVFSLLGQPTPRARVALALTFIFGFAWLLWPKFGGAMSYRGTAVGPTRASADAILPSPRTALRAVVPAQTSRGRG